MTNGNFVLFGDSKGSNLAFDNSQATNYQSNNSACFIGVDFGANLGISLTRIRYFPYAGWVLNSLYLPGGQFEVSQDNMTWTSIYTIDSMAHSGWNIIFPTDQNPYRYLRFTHNSTSQCMLA